jgi:ribonuclease D
VHVDNARLLSEVCSHLAGTRRFALDTEFVGERTYYPKLELIQVASREQVALIDCRAVEDLGPFFEILANRRIQKILHAAQQDLELFESLTGELPKPVIDTQVASALAGYGAQVGYAQLAEKLLGVSLEKSETLSDWSHRPLSKAQLAYAVDDVRYLLPLYEKVRARLTELDRWEWVKEECARIESLSRGLTVPPEEAYLRVRGRGSLRPRGLAVLRELAAWREETARARNKPRVSIARDEALVEIARRAPTAPSALRGLRAVRSREVERSAAEVVERVNAALARPKEEWPQPPPAQGPSPAAGVVELLQAVVRENAEQHSIAASMLATQAELQQLASCHIEANGIEDLRLMQGWRRSIVGEDLISVLDGSASVSIDPSTRRLRIRSRKRQAPAKNPDRASREHERSA